MNKFAAFKILDYSKITTYINVDLMKCPETFRATTVTKEN